MAGKSKKSSKNGKPKVATQAIEALKAAILRIEMVVKEQKVNGAAWAKVRKVIKADAEITGSLLDSKGRSCVIGGLMLAAGIKPRRGQGTPNDGQKEALMRAYPGMTSDMISDLMGMNDAYDDRKERQAALLKEVKGFKPRKDTKADRNQRVRDEIQNLTDSLFYLY